MKKIIFIFMYIFFMNSLTAFEEGVEIIQKQYREPALEPVNTLPYYSLLKPLSGLLCNWKALDKDGLKEAYKEFSYQESTKRGIRGAYFYETKQKLANSNPLIFLIVHGTGFFGRGGCASIAYYDIDCQIFKDILNFACQYANNKKRDIIVLSYAWTGANNFVDRRAAGEVLARFISENFNNHSIITYSHSHGGNVVNVASGYLDWKVDGQPAIELMIHMATPVRISSSDIEAVEYVPKNFKKLISFWTEKDWIQPLGALATKQDVYSLKGRFRKFDLNAPGKIYNIRVQVNGKPVGHSGFVEPISAHLFEILNKLQFYVVHTDLDLDIAANAILLSIRNPIEETPLYKNVLKYILNAEEAKAKNIVIDPDLKKNTPTFIEYEKNISKADEEVFLKKYGKNMHEKKYL